MSPQRRADVIRVTLTSVGLVVAAMAVIAGLVLLGLFIVLLSGIGNFGSNK